MEGYRSSAGVFAFWRRGLGKIPKINDTIFGGLALISINFFSQHFILKRGLWVPDERDPLLFVPPPLDFIDISRHKTWLAGNKKLSNEILVMEIRVWKFFNLINSVTRFTYLFINSIYTTFYTSWTLLNLFAEQCIVKRNNDYLQCFTLEAHYLEYAIYNLHYVYLYL